MTTNTESSFCVHGLSASRTSFYLDNPGYNHHNEFELLFMPRGEAVHEHGGRSYVMPPRRLVVLWGGIPHRAAQRDKTTQLHALHIPVHIFLNWELPRDSFVHPLMRGEVFFESNAANSARDAASMRRWHDDINDPPHADPVAAASRHKALLRELEARLHRFVIGDNGIRLSASADENCPAVVGGILRFIAQNYRDPALDVARIAAEVGVHPNYAIIHFRKTCGLSLMRYVTQQRLNHAKSLLASGDGKILDIALDSGFGSPSRFYQIFRAATGCTPRDFAAAHSV